MWSVKHTVVKLQANSPTDNDNKRKSDKQAEDYNMIPQGNTQ